MAYEKLIDSFANPEDENEITEEPEEESDDESVETEKSNSDEDDEGIDLEDPEK
ncbi:MAG: hypothetical protein Greene071421_414 [Parcubacteria group bacterium Greene0714_21]|nr:MAG: hypothetical protein Greene041639_67 [Parcubacteria group bacterium Greene0416_39]TSC98178.1 MAG: hypothetical protein Greene101447_141 [Parcubacteria group bacterium Greene1014_47]TSD04048.1 MAG: hypothetical protein Greene071421_414 [Parcubacteria group bacterium Greene0714_21]